MILSKMIKLTAEILALTFLFFKFQVFSHLSYGFPYLSQYYFYARFIRDLM